MSSKWMSKVHAFAPLTEQEEKVRDILLGAIGLTYAFVCYECWKGLKP
jgi:hypothetical protein